MYDAQQLTPAKGGQMNAIDEEYKRLFKGSNVFEREKVEPLLVSSSNTTQIMHQLFVFVA